MIDVQPQPFEVRPIVTIALSYVPTWRFIGDRASADLAYCARFGTDEAPEPSVALGGAWAYVLPPAEVTR